MLPSSTRFLLGRWRYRLLSPPSLARAGCLHQTKLLSSSFERRFHASSNGLRIEEKPAASYNPKYEYIEECEELERYCPGGYHPVKLGDQLCNGRYSVAQMLGHGGSSTVWLASDKIQQTLVAVKIKTADSDDQEEDITAQLHDMPSIRRLEDVFVEQDIHAGNILLRLPEDTRRITDTATINQRFGSSFREPIVRRDRLPLEVGVPTHVVGLASLFVRSDEITDSHLPILLSDFTSSYCPSKTRQILSRTLPHIVPPEAFFIDKHNEKETLSFPSEIWTLACTVFDIFGSGGPFSVMGGGILQDQACALGKFPEPWWSQWEERAEFFIEDGTSIEFPNSRDRIEDRYDWFVTATRRRYEMAYPEEDEKKAFLEMIRPMLRYVPSERASIQDVIDSEWMQEWALPCRRPK
ncbi:serine/threonine protein kinase [Nannizzia gypsea CBS 118893]|uniref:non-specific serine/threonine protein kinase n=1 Tax=Arthroderma gypseum (strain ATCC MYA-4604 / CBS 118893) TaxID=535722 RepID=E4UWY0_ARTGP|nr:serine/threonine protein kinase [Nannizzia gypsea CBS 118893]EFR02619.1 serine/threonine protein kinase [Nannizzia gypsea CBS 118893]